MEIHQRDLWNELKCFFKIKVISGAKTRFRKDEWNEEGNLERLFPDIYSLVLHHQSTVAELWTKEGWRFNFKRQFNDWEIPRMTDFINKIEQFSGLGIDELWWKGDEKGTYKVSKAYRKMNHNQQPNTWPWKNIWKTKIPYKVACFVWLLAKEAVLTQENLMKEG